MTDRDRVRVYRADVLVLRRRHLGEADSVFLLYGEPHGRFDAIAKGVRRPRSRRAGHLEPLSRVGLLLARGRNLDIITQAETIESFRAVREDLDRLYPALYIAELLETCTSDGLKHEGLFDLALHALRALDAGVPHDRVLPWFEVRLLGILGHDIQVSACASCGRQLAPEPAFFAPAAGGVVCSDCRSGAGSGRLLSVQAVKVLRFAQGEDLVRFAGVRIAPELAAELRAALGDVVRHVFEREPRTLRYLDGLDKSSVPGSA